MRGAHRRNRRDRNVIARDLKSKTSPPITLMALIRQGFYPQRRPGRKEQKISRRFALISADKVRTEGDSKSEKAYGTQPRAAVPHNFIPAQSCLSG